MPDSSVDLIHTSPPYNIDKAYKGDHGDKQGLERYLDFLRQVIREMKRVLKPNASLFWQTGYTQTENAVAGDILPIDMLSYPFFKEEPPLILWDRIIWRYFGGMAFKRKYTNRHETILWFVKPVDGAATPAFDVDTIRERSRELDKRNNFWGRNPGNVWEVDRVAYGTTEQSSHIAVYPEEVAEKIIRASSKPGDLVVDPFSGSGTTCKVARSLGRRWIGIEISPEYAKESVMRIGFQQPGEVQSLASAILREKVFGGRPGSLPLEEISRRLTPWARATPVDRCRHLFQDALSTVFPNGREAKPRVWQRFDQLIDSGNTHDPVVEADTLLLASYRNRRNQNGVYRYRTGLETLEALVMRVAQSGADTLKGFIEELVAAEPSSYRLQGTNVALLRVDRRLKPPAHASQLEVPWLQAPMEIAAGSADIAHDTPSAPSDEAYQPSLFTSGGQG